MHRRHGQVLTVLLAAATLAALAVPALAADCPDGEGKAKCLLVAANAVKDSNPKEAAKLYLQSYRLDTKIDALAGYGAALAADKQYVAASEALEKAIEEYQDLAKKMQDGNAEAATIFAVVHRIEFVQDQLRQMGLKTAKAKFRGEKLPPNIASVIRKGGDDLRPRNQMQLYITPGGDTLVFTFTDGKVVEKPVNLSPGTLSIVDFPEEPKPEEHKVKERPVVATVDGGSGYKMAAYVTGGIGLVTVGVGIIYGAGNSGTIGGTAAITGVGGAAVGAAVILWMWGNSLKARPVEDQTALVAPMVGDHVVGALVSGRF